MFATTGTELTNHVFNVTLETCALKYDDFVWPISGTFTQFKTYASNYIQFICNRTELYCNWTWDLILCWPPTPAGSNVYQKCPMGHGIDSTSKCYSIYYEK